MLTDFILAHPWSTVIAWVVLYISDYSLTLYGSKLFRSQKIIEIEGSYELNPAYIEDIEKRRIISPNTVTIFILYSVLFSINAYHARQMPLVFLFVAGAIIITELAVHIRHFDNIIEWKRLARNENGEYSGHIWYSRTAVYRSSSIRLLCMAAYTLAAYGLTGNYMLLGGVFGIALITCQHWKLYKEHRQIPAQNERPPAPPSEPGA